MFTFTTIKPLHSEWKADTPTLSVSLTVESH